MESLLTSLVSGEQLVTWLILAALVGFVIYKEWPGIRQRVSSGEIKDRTVADRLDDIDHKLDTMREQLDRDYTRINDNAIRISALEKEQSKIKENASDSLEERELIMKTLLSVLEGLQELGANGDTKTRQKEIREYLNAQAHKEG